jgi:hypothetical protein
MRRKGILSLTIVIGLVVAGLVVPIVFAKGKPHFQGHRMGWAMDSLTATGVVVGLANDDYRVRLRAIGFADATCVSPGGNEEVQGRNPVFVEVNVEDWVTTARNGRASFTLEAKDPTSADIPPSPTPKEAGCPNRNWTVILDPVNWTEAWLFLYALDGTLLDKAHFECDITTPGICTPVE